MGHGITEFDSTFSVREMPWMGLLDGQVHVLEDYPTRQEAQALVHPWEPVETPVFQRVPVITEEGVSHEYVEIPTAKAVERSDTGRVLGVVSSTYGIVTNTEMWDVAEAVGNLGTDIHIETGGSLEEGRKVWILLRLAEPIQIGRDPNGRTLSLLALQNSNDGSGSFRAQAINTRIVCANTSAAADVEAKRNGYEFTFRHTARVGERIEEAKAAVAMWREGVHVWQNAMEHLLAAKVTAEQREQFIREFQPMPREEALITERVRANIEKARSEVREILNGPTQADINDTAFGLFQAGVEYAQHYRKVKGATPRARMESHFKRHITTDHSLHRSTLALVREIAGV